MNALPHPDHVEPISIPERFGFLPAVWGLALVALVAALSHDDAVVAAIVAGAGLLLAAWEIVRRLRRATLHIQGDLVEVRRRGVRVDAFPARSVLPRSTIKNFSDGVRGTLIALLILLTGGLMATLDRAVADIGVGFAVVGLATLASMIYVHRCLWTIEAPRQRGHGTLTLSIRRGDLRGLLDRGSSPRPFAELVRAARARLQWPRVATKMSRL